MKDATDLRRDRVLSEKEIEERALKQHGADSDALGRAVSALKALKEILPTLVEPFPAVEAT